MHRLLALAIALAAVAPLSARADAHAADAPTAKFTLVNIEYEGTKVWVPGTMVVKKGTKVTVKLINNTPSGPHGFSIPSHDVNVVVEKGTPATVEFTASEDGLFPTICHLHPAHIGGQLLVVP